MTNRGDAHHNEDNSGAIDLVPYSPLRSIRNKAPGACYELRSLQSVAQVECGHALQALPNRRQR